MSGEPVRAWEVEIVRALDAAMMKAARSMQEGGAATEDPKRWTMYDGKKVSVSERPITPALFDALFGGGR